MSQTRAPAEVETPSVIETSTSPKRDSVSVTSPDRFSCDPVRDRGGLTSGRPRQAMRPAGLENWDVRIRESAALLRIADDSDVLESALVAEVSQGRT